LILKKLGGDMKSDIARTGPRKFSGNSKEGNTNLSFTTEASISEEPSAVVPHAGICAGAVR